MRDGFINMNSIKHMFGVNAIVKFVEEVFLRFYIILGPFFSNENTFPFLAGA